MRLSLKISSGVTVVTVQNETKSEISSGVTDVTVQNETKSENFIWWHKCTARPDKHFLSWKAGDTGVTVKNETKSDNFICGTNVQSDLTSTFWVEKLVTQV